MARALAPPPDPFVARDPKGTLTDAMTDTFRLWLLTLTGAIQAASRVLKAVPLTAQSSAIGSTSIPVGTLTAGLYRLTFYAAITTAASVSSSLTVTFGWTEGGISKAVSATAITGNTTTTTGSSTYLVRADGGTLLTYSTAYASVGGTAMSYSLDLTAEQLS